MKFLIVKPSSLGDVLHAFPALSLLAKANPGSKADWLIHPAFAPLLEYHPDVDRAIPFKRRELGSAASFAPAFLSLLKDLRSERYDAAIDLQGLMRSAFISRLSRAGAHLGPAKPKEPLAKLFYSELVPVPPDAHAVERNLAMVSPFVPEGSRGVPDLELPVIEGNRKDALKILADAGLPEGSKLIGIAPGARWDTKRWPPEFFAKLVSEMAKSLPDAAFVLTGSASDSPIASKMLSLLPSERVTDLTGKTGLGQLVELVRSLSLFIANDSGPMHVAAAVGTPLVALFGPTDPALTGPRSSRSLVVQPQLDCIKCLKRYCQKILCHASLGPAETAKAALEFMDRRTSS